MSLTRSIKIVLQFNQESSFQASCSSLDSTTLPELVKCDEELQKQVSETKIYKCRTRTNIFINCINKSIYTITYGCLLFFLSFFAIIYSYFNN